MTTKPRVIKDFDKLAPEILDQIKLKYPYGFEKYLILFKNAQGAFVSALPFETDDRYYLVRMTKAEAREIIEDDDDYDEYGRLKPDARDDLEAGLESDDDDDDFDEIEGLDDIADDSD